MHFVFNVEYRRKQDCCSVEANLATITYLGYYQIINAGVSHYNTYCMSNRNANQINLICQQGKRNMTLSL